MERMKCEVNRSAHAQGMRGLRGVSGLQANARIVFFASSLHLLVVETSPKGKSMPWKLEMAVDFFFSWPVSSLF